MANLPVLNLGGDPFERGLAHGRTLAPAIRDNLETYLRRFETAGVARDAVFAQGEAWAAFMADDTPDYFAEMRGIAEGSAVSLRDIAILNARYEITYTVLLREATGGGPFGGGTGPAPLDQEGCTSFGALGEATANGHTLLGQNWDWLEGVRGRTFIKRVHRGGTPDRRFAGPDGSGSGGPAPDYVGFTEAGIAGCKMGVNAAGIGLCVNGLVTAADGRKGMRRPFHARCQAILDAWRFDQAILPIVQTDRTCSTNFLIGHVEGEILNIEATPDRHAVIPPQDGLVCHANHLVREHRVASEMERISPHSLYRGPRLEKLLRRRLGTLDDAGITEALQDHFGYPAAICRHADPALPAAKRVITVAAILIDLDDRCLLATDGPPCENPFQRFPLYPAA